jgi:hypothetical protein
MQVPDWITRTESVAAVTVEVAFLVSDSFYFGDENDLDRLQQPEFREPLYQPKFERYDNFILTSAIEESPAELIAYYRDVVRLIRKYRKDIKALGHYFWIRPLVFSRGLFAIDFPWYDTQQEAERFLDSLGRPDLGELFWDRDQCWELTIWADSESLYFREWDPDYQEEHVAVRCDKRLLQDQLPLVRGRLNSLLQKLGESLGQDFWSR